MEHSPGTNNKLNLVNAERDEEKKDTPSANHIDCFGCIEIDGRKQRGIDTVNYGRSYTNVYHKDGAKYNEGCCVRSREVVNAVRCFIL